MERNIINTIQNKALDLVPHKDGSLLKDSCSEVTRLVAGWLLEEGLPYNFFIYKGENVFGTNLSHDVLILSNNEETIIFDPTIWQFKPEAKSILIAILTNKSEVIKKLIDTYEGNWFLSERITKISEEEKEEFLDIIYKNAKEE